jgi:hypothetical protein
MCKKLDPWLHVRDCFTDNLSIYLGRRVDGQRSTCLIESYVRQKIGTLLCHGAFVFDTIFSISESDKENLPVLGTYLVIDAKNEAVNCDLLIDGKCKIK